MELKLPRFEVTRTEDEGFSLGKLSGALILGFGMHWAWVYLTMFNGIQLFVGAEAIEAGVSSRPLHVCSLVVLASLLLSYGGFSHTFRRLFLTRHQRMRNRLIASVCASAGTFLLFFINVAAPAGPLVLVAAAVLTGLGSGVLLMSYGVSFSMCDIATTVTSTALSLFIGVLTYALLANLDVALHPLGGIIVSLIPFLECFCLHRCSTELIDNLAFGNVTLQVRKTPFAARICIPSFMFGIALGFIRFFAVDELHAFGTSGLSILLIVGAGTITGLLMVAAMLTQRQHFNFIFRTMLPFIVVIIVGVQLSGSAREPLTILALSCAYILFEGIMWISYADLSQRYRVSAFLSFGYGRGSLALGALVSVLYLWYFPGIGTQTVITIVALALIVLGEACLPRTAEMEGLIIRKTDKIAPDQPGEGDDAEDTDAVDGKPDDAGKANVDEDDKTAAKRKQLGRYKKKCRVVANRYLLSKRETEVLFILAKGRNAAFVQEQLFISEGTARTHMRHIYRKLDVHTQQELIDLVESITDEEILEQG